ncbi:MAG: hypothetical protein UY39_C0010G0006 [Candidatus Kaiserbacteria bacterium GW2011_GWC2_49_12]|uniref:Uncharacterized protein n=4 Tax=Candidatus Kaiseribacteriota TaxID=1752734 RepID=A0A0G1WFB9_9BACT|nr:MAG: hypothetical protein UY39_C0010G0006 [Candidatus Kaiserbacteria bacterium GW2011_GWC2_49_12]KKW09277.1 MAG: hypothetical protein UY46_C0004G0004 [Candidatus Kaiserbacteria bacterium GW2011_GWA2_49_56]KKW17310.1 MAG: hypothetical protein UY57_C0019G0005 [Candidatus Kaiserbacteria bacterium GW2011_GWB1_50_17]KKW18176.1 MAG: hypothetical protein UY59_C0013G0005 [Candidatus Kaiserbacteria bacterium GW2011_GWA1_50_28]
MASKAELQYLEKNKSVSYCMLVVEPKIEKVRKRFTQLVQQ